MKYFSWLLAFVALALAGFYFFVKAQDMQLETMLTETDIRDFTDVKLKAKANLLQHYAVKNGYNTERCIIINMNLASGCDRLFLYDLKNDSVLDKGLVAHGRCRQRWLEGRRYGNKIGCGCSSLGKYKIGKAYQGAFGLAYKLYGLDSSNSNAFERFVVLHAHECIPEAPIFPDPICQSDGCPTVSPQMLVRLAKVIDKSDKPVLLFIFDEG